MNTTRRRFVSNASRLAFLLPLTRYGRNPLPDPAPDLPIPAFGIQLYMVRDEMEKDAPGTLRQLQRMGYRQLESFGGNKGMFWGLGNKGFARLCRDHGLDLVSSHYNDEPGGFEHQAAAAAEIGMKYLICPWKGPQASLAAFEKIAEEFMVNGGICQKHGIRFAYHPHDYPYKQIDGRLPIDLLLERTDKTLVDFEMDFYYTVTEGQDPAAYFRNYPGRFRLCHLRDVLKERLPAGSKEESATDLGKGIIGYPELLATGAENGLRYYFVEQSRYAPGETPLESARINADYLRRLLKS